MLTPNTILQNRYLIIRLLAQGGMGAVYEARDQRLGSTVALKETFFTDEEMRQAFHREASLLAALRHQSLPKVTDHFSEGDGQFLVMEYIRGDDLAKLLQMHGRALPPRDVLIWGDQLLSALDYIHTHKPPIIHRDIKPQNLKLNERGEVILLDFGLAKGKAAEAEKSSLSVRGYTLSYAPIEQIHGEGTDPRSDLYSAAATLYHLLTGVVPPDAVTRASAVIHNRPDPLRPANELNAQVSPAVARLLQQAMAQDRSQRFETAAAFRAALRHAASGVQPVTPESGATINHRFPAPTIPNTPPIPTAPNTAVPLNAAVPGQLNATSFSKRWLWIGGGAATLILLIIIGGVMFWSRGTTATKPKAPTTSKPAIPDLKNATPLTSTELLSRGFADERYYTFTALPGELKVILDLAGNGASLSVELLDAEKKPFRFDGNRTSLSVSSSGLNEQEVGKLILDREQPVLLKIKTPYPDSVNALRVRLEGAVKVADKPANAPDDGSSALAQYFADRDNPTNLVTKEIYGSQGTKKELYYYFNAGPGELKLMMNLIGSGSSFGVEVFDADAQHLRFASNSTKLSLSSSGLNEQENGRLLLEKEQPLLMRLTIPYPRETRGFRVRLDGPITLAIDGLPEETAKASAAMAPMFEPRDKPQPLVAKEIGGSNGTKESYYTLTAGPGQVKVTLDLEASGSNIGVEFFDSEAKAFRFDNNNTKLSVSSSGKPEQKSASLTLDRELKLLLRLTNPYPDSTKSYHVQIDGTVKLSN